MTFVLQKSLADTDYLSVYKNLREQYLNNPHCSWLKEKRNEIQKEKPLEIEGILLTKLDNRNTIGYKIVEKVKFEFPYKTFNTIISVSSHIQEAPMYGKSVIQFSYNSRGSKEYRDLAKEILDASSSSI